MADWDTTAFLVRVRDRTRLPSTRSGYGDADTLRVAYDELVSQVVPMLVAQQQEHLVGSGRIALVEGRRDYRIPARAAGARVRLVELEDVNGDTTPMTRLSPEDLSGVAVSTTLGLPAAFVVEGNLLRLFPKPTGVSGYALRVRFYDRPGRLVLPPEAGTPGAAKVTGVAGLVLTISGESSLPVGAQTVDIVRSTPAFETLQADASATRAGTSLTLTDSTLAALVATGDYVCIPGTAPVPQVPPEFHPLLAMWTAQAQLGSKGDGEAASELAGEAAGRREPLAKALARPRSDGNPQKQVNGTRRWGIGRWGW